MPNQRFQTRLLSQTKEETIRWDLLLNRAKMCSARAATLDKVIIGNDLMVRKTARDLEEVEIVVQVDITGTEATREELDRVVASHATKLAKLATKTVRGKDRSQLRPLASRVSFSKTTKIRRAFKTVPPTMLVMELAHSPSS